MQASLERNARHADLATLDMVGYLLIWETDVLLLGDNISVVGDNQSNNNAPVIAPAQPRNTYKKINKISYLRF